MKTEIISNEYSEENRICTQKTTYARYDDLYTLGQYYIKLAETLYALTLPNANLNKLEEDRIKLETLIKSQQIILNGYGGADNAENQSDA